MSTRQRARLETTVKLGLEEEVDSDNESVKPVKKSSYADAFDDSSSSSESEDQEEEKDEPSNVIAAEVIIAEKPIEPELEATKDSDLELLDSIIKELNEASVMKSKKIDTNSILFSIDPKALDVDVVAKKRFGKLNNLLREGGGEAIGRNNRGINRRMANSLPIKHSSKFLFGSPKDDWVKPPSFTNGGLGMSRIAIKSPVSQNESFSEASTQVYQYTFDLSEDYKVLQTRFNRVQRTGDPNRLIIFLAKVYKT